MFFYIIMRMWRKLSFFFFNIIFFFHRFDTKHVKHISIFSDNFMLLKVKSFFFYGSLKPSSCILIFTQFVIHRFKFTIFFGFNLFDQTLVTLHHVQNLTVIPNMLNSVIQFLQYTFLTIDKFCSTYQTNCHSRSYSHYIKPLYHHHLQ